jgi:hypothetical protein
MDALESHLAGTLRPVAPPKSVMQGLRGRIHLPQRSEIVWRVRDWRSLFLALSGALSGVLLIVTVARALFYLVGRRSN